jgi:hypothetical protein
LGKASRRKWNRRKTFDDEAKLAIARQENNVVSLSAQSKSSVTRKTFIFLATIVVSALVGIIFSLRFSVPFARLLSFRRQPVVTVSYVIQKNGTDCDYYTIGIHPQDPRDTIKSLTLHLQFPGEIRSLDYGMDHTVWKDGKTPAIEDTFAFEPPCNIKAAVPSDLPSSIQIKRTGQRQKDLVIDIQNLDASSSLMVVSGATRSLDPRLTYTGQAIYSALNQDIPAPIRFTWIDGPK